MDLEEVLINGSLLVGSGLMLYATIKVAYDVGNIRKSTTKFLDTTISYLSQRVSKPEDIKSLAELAKYRTKVGL